MSDSSFAEALNEQIGNEFAAPRGRVSIMPSPDLADITSGFGQWTIEDDADAITEAVKEAFRKALRSADFKSVRGAFKFNKNQFPVQNLYMRVVDKDAQGRVTNKLVGTVFTDHSDPFAASCVMP